MTTRMNLQASRLYRAVWMVLAIGVWIALAPIQIGGQVAYVIIAGSSMEPGFHLGDLAIVRRAASYAVGDVVAYRHPDIGPVFHRIVQIETGQDEERFVLQGDNNTWLDGYSPTQTEIIGKLWLHWPAVGRVIVWLRTPWVLAALAVLAGLMVLSFLGPGQARARKSKRTRGVLVAPQVNDNRQDLFTACAVLLVGAVILGVFSFIRPAYTAVPDDVPYQHQGTFSYDAPAPAGIYDGDTVHTGEPIFFQLSQGARFQFDYRFATSLDSELTGTVRLLAELRHANGWKRTIELVPETAFSGPTCSVQTDLDLAQIRQLVATLEGQTGLERQRYTLSILPQVRVSGTVGALPLEDSFAPQLSFHVDALQVVLLSGQEGGAAPLQPSAAGSIARSRQEHAPFSILGIKTRVWTARWIAVIGAAAALSGMAALEWPSLTGKPGTHLAQVRHRYGRLLVEVQAAGFEPEDGVRVASVDDLVRVAERLGLAIMHQAQNEEHVFFVQDGGKTFYCRLSDLSPEREGRADAAGSPVGRMGQRTRAWFARAGARLARRTRSE